MKFTLSKDTEITVDALKKILEQNRFDNARLHKLEQYYLGKHSILSRVNKDTNKPNNKVVNPYAQYITDTLCGYFVGEPITYSSLDEKAVEELTMVLNYNDCADADMALAKDASIYGCAYEMLYIDEDGVTRFTRVKPTDVIIIYDDSVENEILYAIRLIPCYDIITDKHSFRIEVYSATEVKYYTANDSLGGITYIDEQPHYFGLVPFVEYKNNEQELGDYETIIPLIDAYDKLESDSLNDFEYFVDAYLLLTGVSADAEDIKQMKENRVLLLDDDAKAEWLIKNASDSTIENLKNRIQTDIHKFAKVPDLADENFASNASGVAIKYKLYGTETLIATKERKFKKGLQRRIELIYNIIALKGGSAYDWRGIDISFTRNLPSNETEIADIIQKLSGVVSTETLLAQIPFVQDVNAEMARLEAQKETQPFYDLKIETAEDEAEEVEA